MSQKRGWRRTEPQPWLKAGIFLGGLVPLINLALRGSQQALGANPIAAAENELGLTAFIFLIGTLSCTPAKLLFGWAWPTRVRRELGLFAFCYALLHLGAYLVLDQFFDFSAIIGDIAKRPFITVGFVAMVLLVALAITSASTWPRLLGHRHRQRIHRLVYLAGVLVAIHFVWRVKVDLTQPLIYAFLVAVLLATRVAWVLVKRFLSRRSQTSSN